MIPLIRLKKDVLFNTELTHVVDVLKGIAAVRFHLLERQQLFFEQYGKTAEEFLTTVDFTKVGHPFIRSSVQRVGVVVVTSDAGFLGGLNSQVVNAGLKQVGTAGFLLVIGERGSNLLRDLHVECETFPGIEESTRTSLALAVRDRIVHHILSGTCGRFLVVYPHPISFTVQKVTLEFLLPLEEWLVKKQTRMNPAHLIWESRLEDLVEYLVVEWIGSRLEVIFALSRLAELAARAMHLEGSYQELIRQGKQLKLKYFRARHELIDRSMREIFSAQLLYGKEQA